MTVSTSIRIYQALYEQAKQDASLEHRSIAGQIEFWARVGRAALDNTASDVDCAVDEVSQNPDTGDRKKGDLLALHVFKFFSVGMQSLLGYTLGEEVRLIYLEALGPHANFSQDLKR